MRLASARSYALLSVAAALITIALKTLAWSVTGSVGLLSDALESSVNLVAALTAFWALGQASKPADRNHSFGHSKAEYFSSGLESALIVVAAIGIIWAAAGRCSSEPISSVDLGLTLSLIATALNGAVAWLFCVPRGGSAQSRCGLMPNTCSAMSGPRSASWWPSCWSSSRVGWCLIP